MAPSTRRSPLTTMGPSTVKEKPVVPEAAPDVDDADVAPPRGGLCMG